MKKVLSIFLITVITFSLFTIGGCGKKQNDVIKIGADLVLSGNVAYFGENIQKSMLLAAEEINSKGGIKGKQLKIIFKDNEKVSQRNISAFRELVDIEKVPVVISMLSPLSVPLRPIADSKKVLLISTIVSYPNFTEGYHYVLRDFISSDIESQTMAEFIFNEKKIKKLACLYVDDDYGRGAFEVLKHTFENLGGRVVASDGFAQNRLEFRNILHKFYANEPEAFYLVGREQSFAVAIKQIRETGFKGNIFTCISLNSPNVLKLLGDIKEGIYFTNIHYYPDNPSNEIEKHFINAFEKKYKEVPNYLAVYGYDIVYYLKSAIEEVGFTPDEIVKGLINKRFNSIRGSIFIGEDKDVQSKIDICQVRNGKFIIVK